MFSADMRVIELGVPIPEKPPQALHHPSTLLMKKVDLVVTLLIVSLFFFVLSTHGLQNTIG